MADEFFPEVDRLLVRRAAEMVIAEEKAAEPGTAMAVPNGAAPVLFEPEPIDGDIESPFSYAGRPVRVVDLDGEPWFVAADVCAVLGIRDVSDAVGRLDDADRGQTPIRSVPGGQARLMWAVSEAGLYELIIRSDKPEARPFRRWVTSEVLPSIRRTGAYVSPTITPTQLDQLSEELEARKTVALLSVLTAARDLVGDDWTQARARSLVAGVVGGEAEIDMERRPLMIHTYLKEKGLSHGLRKTHGSNFGKVVKALYIAKYGKEPGTRETDVDGHWFAACTYSERDRPLLDQAWRQFEQSFRGNETDY